MQVQSLQSEILSFGQEFAHNDALYGIYLKCIYMSQDEAVTRQDFEMLKKKEPIMEQMLNYARYLSGSQPQFKSDIEVLDRHVYHLSNLQNPTAEEVHALEFIERQLKWAKNEDYNAYKLNTIGMLDENGQYSHGHLNETLYNLYEKTLEFIRRLEKATDSFYIENVKMEYIMFRQDLFDRVPYRNNSAFNKRGRVYKDTFLGNYYKR